jgi:hypothetical protein
MPRNDQVRRLRATLCEIERGLYYAAYRTRRPPPYGLGLPEFRLGISAYDAGQCIEQSVKDLGYETIIWTDAIVPPSHSHRQNRLSDRQPVSAVQVST